MATVSPSNSRVSGKGQFTEQVNVDIYSHGFGSYTSFSHDRADSYRINPLEYVKGEEDKTQQSLSPLFTGYRNNLVSQRFTWQTTKQLAFNAGMEYGYKKTDRPNTNPDITGGLDYEMRYKSLRWNVGGIYKWNSRNSIQTDFTVDRYRYGKEYDVETKTYKVGDYVQSKKQRTMDGEVKAILGLTPNSTTIFGVDWRNDMLVTTSGNIDNNAYTLSGYGQHEMALPLHLKATVGARYTYHKEFGSRLTPKVALMFSNGPIRLRATYSNGFRAPGLDELYYRYFSVNRGKPQVSFGNKNLKSEASHYVSLGAEYRVSRFSLSVMGYINRINDMIIKDNIKLTDPLREMLKAEFPEMTDEEIVKYPWLGVSKDTTGQYLLLPKCSIEPIWTIGDKYRSKSLEIVRKIALGINQGGKDFAASRTLSSSSPSYLPFKMWSSSTFDKKANIIV